MIRYFMEIVVNDDPAADHVWMMYYRKRRRSLMRRTISQGLINNKRTQIIFLCAKILLYLFLCISSLRGTHDERTRITLKEIIFMIITKDMKIKYHSDEHIAFDLRRSRQGQIRTR